MRCWPPEKGLPSRRAALVLLLAGIAVGVAGCGNEKRDFRTQRLNPLIERTADQRSTFAEVLRITRPRRRRDAAVLRSQLAPIATTMRRIAALSPPDGTDDDFRRYTRANASLVAALRRFIDVYARGTASQRSRAAKRVETATAAAAGAERALLHALQ